MEMSNIRSVIGGFRLRVRALTLGFGLGHLIAVACFLAVGTFVCDYLFRLPVGVRLTLLGISLAILLVTAFRRLVLPLGVAISDDDAALCIETAYPDLDCRLISSIQIDRMMGDKRYIFSRPLAQRLIADTDKMAVNLSVSRVVRSGPTMKRIGTTALYLLILGVACAAEPVYFERWVDRIMGGSSSYPRDTDLDIVYTPRVVRGDDVVVKVRALKGDPSRVRLYFKFPSGDQGWVSAERTSQDGDAYVYTFKQVMERFDFMVSGGDYDGDYLPVEIRMPPRIEDVAIALKFPDYTRIPPIGEDSPQKNGNIKAIQGTEATFIGRCNIELAEAAVTFKTGEQGRRSGMTILGDKKTVKGVFKVENNCEYEIALKSLDGLANREPVKYRIDVVPDRNPTVAILRPAADMEAPPKAVIPLTIEASDDFGVKEMSLVYSVKPKGEGEDKVENRVEKTVRIPFEGEKEPFGRTNVKAVHPFNIEALTVKDAATGKERPIDEGDTVSYYVQVADFNPRKGIGQSGKFVFNIVSVLAIIERVEAAQRDILHELELIKGDQERNLGDTREIGKLALLKPSGDEAKQLSGQIYEKERTQENVTSKCRDVVVRLTKLIDQIEFFKLEQVKITGELEIVHSTVGKVASEKSPSAQQMLKVAGALNEHAPKALKDAAFVEGKIVEDLSVAIALMRKWSDISSVIRSIEDMRRKQGQVKEGLTGAGGNGGGVKPPEEPKKEEPKPDPRIAKVAEAKKVLEDLQKELTGVKPEAADVAGRLTPLPAKCDQAAALLAAVDGKAAEAFKPVRQMLQDALTEAKKPKASKISVAAKLKDALKTIGAVLATLQ